MNSLVIKKNQLQQIIEYCEQERPKEACGVLSGKDSQVANIYFLKNISDNPQFCYLVDPREQLAVFKEIRQKNQEVLAIFHSHIDAPAYPSPRDLELAFYPEVVYLIVSFRNTPAEVRGFSIKEREIKEVKIEVIPE